MNNEQRFLIGLRFHSLIYDTRLKFFRYLGLIKMRLHEKAQQG